MAFSAYAAYFFLALVLLVVYWQVKKTNEESEKILLVSFSISALFLVLTYVFLLFIKTSFTPPLIPVGSIDAWIGFSGSILGGTITVFALVFTINNEKRLREKEYEIQKQVLREENSQRLMPVIEIGPKKDGDSGYNEKVYGDDDLSYRFVISNVSENHARDIEIRAVEYFVYDNTKTKIDITKDLFTDPKSIKILSSNRNSEFYVGLCSNKLDSLYPEVFNQSEISLFLTLEITLHDIHKLSQHSFISNVFCTLYENIDDSSIYWPGDYGEDDKELYNKYDLKVHTCQTDIK